MKSPYRILLVDDHDICRAGIAAVLDCCTDIEIVGEAENGFEAVAQAREKAPDLILMDITMPQCTGLEALRLIKREMPQIKVVMLTVSEEDDDVFQAVQEGAEGYLIKNINRQVLLDKIEGVRKGEAPISGVMAVKILKAFRKEPPESQQERKVDELTPRETQILQHVAAGEKNREIAKALSIAENTVKIHVSNILGKLHLRNRVEAAVYAVEEGLITDSDEN